MHVRSNQVVYMDSPAPFNALTAVLAYLQTNQYRRASFDRLIANIPGLSTPDQLYDVIRNNPNIFTSIQISGGLPGLRIRDSWDGTIPTPAPVPEEGLAESDLNAPTAPAAPVVPPTEGYVRKLIQRAADATMPNEAKQFAEAALHAANAYTALVYANNIPQNVPVPVPASSSAD